MPLKDHDRGRKQVTKRLLLADMIAKIGVCLGIAIFDSQKKGRAWRKHNSWYRHKLIPRYSVVRSQSRRQSLHFLINSNTGAQV